MRSKILSISWDDSYRYSDASNRAIGFVENAEFHVDVSR